MAAADVKIVRSSGLLAVWNDFAADQAEIDPGLVHRWTRRGRHGGVVAIPLLTKPSERKLSAKQFIGFVDSRCACTLFMNLIVETK